MSASKSENLLQTELIGRQSCWMWLAVICVGAAPVRLLKVSWWWFWFVQPISGALEGRNGFDNQRYCSGILAPGIHGRILWVNQSHAASLISRAWVFGCILQLNKTELSSQSPDTILQVLLCMVFGAGILSVRLACFKGWGACLATVRDGTCTVAYLPYRATTH